MLCSDEADVLAEESHRRSLGVVSGNTFWENWRFCFDFRELRNFFFWESREEFV